MNHRFRDQVCCGIAVLVGVLICAVGLVLMPLLRAVAVLTEGWEIDR